MTYRYSLKNGKSLKNAAEEVDIKKILSALEKCWREIHKQFPEEYDDTDLENNLDDIEREEDNYQYFEDYDLTYEEVVDNVNDLIKDLNYYCKISNIYVDTMEEDSND